MAKRVKKRLNQEAVLWFIIGALLLAIPICEVYVKAKLSESNIALEEIKEKISEQEGINESLRMEINELASLDKIQEVANEIGLTYNNSNVKVVINE